LLAFHTTTPTPHAHSTIKGAEFVKSLGKEWSSEAYRRGFDRITTQGGKNGFEKDQTITILSHLANAIPSLSQRPLHFADIGSDEGATARRVLDRLHVEHEIKAVGSDSKKECEAPFLENFKTPHSSGKSIEATFVQQNIAEPLRENQLLSMHHDVTLALMLHVIYNEPPRVFDNALSSVTHALDNKGLAVFAHIDNSPHTENYISNIRSDAGSRAEGEATDAKVQNTPQYIADALQDQYKQEPGLEIAYPTKTYLPDLSEPEWDAVANPTRSEVQLNQKQQDMMHIASWIVFKTTQQMIEAKSWQPLMSRIKNAVKKNQGGSNERAHLNDTVRMQVVLPPDADQAWRNEVRAALDNTKEALPELNLNARSMFEEHNYTTRGQDDVAVNMPALVG
jgi:hypothetical protein